MTIARSLYILRDPGGQFSRGGKKSQRARKNSGEEKSRTRERAPGDKVLTDQSQTVGAALASEKSSSHSTRCREGERSARNSPEIRWTFLLEFSLVLFYFFSSANNPDKYGEQLACMYISCK